MEELELFFVPPDSDDPIGTIMLRRAPETRKTKTGRVAVRKELLDPAGNPSRGDLGGITFQITTPEGSQSGSRSPRTRTGMRSRSRSRPVTTSSPSSRPHLPSHPWTQPRPKTSL
jgi:hypothetical protein